MSTISLAALAALRVLPRSSERSLAFVPPQRETPRSHCMCDSFAFCSFEPFALALQRTRITQAHELPIFRSLITSLTSVIDRAFTSPMTSTTSVNDVGGAHTSVAPPRLWLSQRSGTPLEFGTFACLPTHGDIELSPHVRFIRTYRLSSPSW